MKNELLNLINSKYPPQMVPIEVETYAIENNCFYNVFEKVSKDCGEIIYGWKIRQSKLLVEAERHAVWKSPTGNLLDITPDSNNRTFSEFVEEDNGWTFNGQYTDNIRINITKDTLVDDYILLCETITKLWQTSTRKSHQKILILEPIKKLIDILETSKSKFELFILENQDRKSPCFCGSLLKYNECHIFNIQTQSDILITARNLVGFK